MRRAHIAAPCRFAPRPMHFSGPAQRFPRFFKQLAKGCTAGCSAMHLSARERCPPTLFGAAHHDTPPPEAR